MTEIDPTVRPDPLPEDFDRALRPQMLSEFVGQAEARANLSVFIQSARQRGAFLRRKTLADSVICQMRYALAQFKWLSRAWIISACSG